MRKILVLILGLGALGGGALLLGRREPGTPPPAPKPREPEAPKWVEISDGDFEERRVDASESRVALRLATRGTKPDTVKILGVRRDPPIRLGRETRIRADLTWTKEENASYLAAAIVIAPEQTSVNALRMPDWIKVEYVGVPPRRNGRLVAAARQGGRDLMPFTEGWPAENRGGRALSTQKVELVLRKDAVEVWENGSRVYETKDIRIPWPEVRLYLQVSSQANFPSREILFENVQVATLD